MTPTRKARAKLESALEVYQWLYCECGANETVRDVVKRLRKIIKLREVKK